MLTYGTDLWMAFTRKNQYHLSAATSTQNNQAVERAAFGGFFALEIWIQYNSDNLLPTVSIYVLFIFCGGV